MKALVIDLSRDHEIKILNARITSSVSIVSGYYLNIPEGEDPIAAAAGKLQDEGLLNLPAFIIPPGGDIEKQNFHLPKMPDKEIKKVLPRQISDVRDNASPVVFNYFKNGPVEERQVQKMEISAFFCSKERMFGFLDKLKEAGINPLKIIPEVQGLKTLVELNPELRGERKGVVLLDLMHNRIDLNIFRNIYWGLERNFMFRMAQGYSSSGEDSAREDDLNEEDFSRISTELNRTFQYFKQRNRSYMVDQVLLYGASANIEPLKNLVNDNLPVTASVITPEHFRNKVTFPSHLKESQEFLSLFTLTISTAVAVSGKKYLDLYPEEFKEKAKLPTRLLGLGVSAIIIAAILLGSTFYFEGIKNNYKQDIARIQKTFLSLSENAVTIDRTKKKRAAFYMYRFYNDFPLQYSYSASDFIRRLSLVASEDIELLEIQMNPTGQTFTFMLTGRIKAENNITAQSKFLEFYQALKYFEDILHVESSRVNVKAEEDKGQSMEEAEDRETRQNRQVELYFTVNGEVEPA